MTAMIKKIQQKSTRFIDPQQPLDHIVKDLWNHVMVLDSQKSKFTSQRDLPCFNFAKGNCRLNDCKYSHATSPSNDDSSSSSRRKSAQQSSPPTRYRSRSPRKKQLPVRFQLSPPPPARKETAFFKQSNRGYGGKGGAGGKGGKGYGSGSRIYEVNPGPGRRGKGAADQQEPYTPKTPQWPPNDHPTACFKMYDVSKCSDKDCTSYHGMSARDTARDCPALRTKSHCPRLWQQRGCGFYHEQNNHNHVPKTNDVRGDVKKHNNHTTITKHYSYHPYYYPTSYSCYPPPFQFNYHSPHFLFHRSPL